MVLDLNKKTYFLITGASRGIGQMMAIKMAAKLKAGSVMVLIARSSEGLMKTKAAIETLRNDVAVQTYSIDLSETKATNLKAMLLESMKNYSVESFERAFIIHNAGTVGDVSKKAIDISDTDTWSQYYYTNLFSTIALNAEFFQTFAAIPKLVVNLSSKCGIEPFASMSFYCSGKAARDMYFKVLALEESETDTLVLNYAPGAIDTDMTIAVQNDTINKELHEAFKQQRISNTMLTTEQTCEKFLQVLEENKFKSGAHVDYWD